MGEAVPVASGDPGGDGGAWSKTGSPSTPLSDAKQKLMDEFRAWFRDWLPEVRKLAMHV